MDDLISRQAAIDAVSGIVSSMSVCLSREEYRGMKRMQGNAVDVIKELPSAEPQERKTGRWIPCSRDLPKNNNPVNVTWINHNPEVYYMDIKEKPFTATAHYHNGYWYWYSSVTQDYLDEYGAWTPDLVDKDVEITAWMPLPEPYKEDNNE